MWLSEAQEILFPLRWCCLCTFLVVIIENSKEGLLLGLLLFSFLVQVIHSCNGATHHHQNK